MESRHFDKELLSLKQNLLFMAAKVEELIDLSIDSLKLRDKQIAESIFDLDKKIDLMEIDLEKKAIELIALHQPTAGNLRLIIGIIKINTGLERIGDHGVNIAQSALKLMNEPQLKPLVDIPRMAVETKKMLQKSLDSLVLGNVDNALDVCRSDDLIDNLKNQIFRELLTYMLEDRRNISRAMELILVSRNLERIADIATNIAEETIYIYEATVIKHRVNIVQ